MHIKENIKAPRYCPFVRSIWWRHHATLCNGNPKGSLKYVPIMRSCGVSFVATLNKLLKKQSSCGCHTVVHTDREFDLQELLWHEQQSFTYTSGQPYGITITKWHLPECDRYLLFLVVCSIAERNAVDLIDPLRNQIEWPNTVSTVWAPLRLKRRKKVSSGVVTWNEICLAITTLMLLYSVGFR